MHRPFQPFSQYVGAAHVARVRFGCYQIRYLLPPHRAKATGNRYGVQWFIGNQANALALAARLAGS